MGPRDTNCRYIGADIQLIEQQGLAVSALVEDLPVTLDQIREPETWLDWPTAATIMDRVEALVGGSDEIAELSTRSVQVLTDRFYNRLFQLVVSPPQLYRMAVKIIAPSICPYHQHMFERQTEGQLRVVLRIPETGPGCTAFFHSAKGLFVGLPRILAMQDAEVRWVASKRNGARARRQLEG